MKFFALSLLLASFTAQAECQREAQFMGTAYDVRHSETSTSYRILLGDWFQPSGVCPMWEDEAAQATVESPRRLNLEDGQEVSGVLLLDATGVYRVE